MFFRKKIFLGTLFRKFSFHEKNMYWNFLILNFFFSKKNNFSEFTKIAKQKNSR